MTRLVSTVAVVDLEAACALYGHDSPPEPLGRTRPVGSLWLATRGVAPISARLDGELTELRRWVEAFVDADECLECRVSSRDGRTADRRLHVIRSGDAGFVALQRSAETVETVDIYEVSPPDLAEVVSYSVGLVGAGSRPCIAVTDVGDEYDAFGIPVPQANSGDPSVDVVDPGEVVAIGTIQSAHGFAPIRWVQIRDDGDYLCASADARYAEPLDVESLHTYVEEFIARR